MGALAISIARLCARLLLPPTPTATDAAAAAAAATAGDGGGGGSGGGRIPASGGGYTQAGACAYFTNINDKTRMAHNRLPYVTVPIWQCPLPYVTVSYGSGPLL
ncbi:hypothetical protein T492DRAFT_847570 [Pavlovales sp. CCMP2436]|nr:hypothetical protein T492DRAFT_847570 [Pavlovales sp. CCMP2436]